MTDVIEIMARAIDPDVWSMDGPVPTRADVIAFHDLRQKSSVKATAILAALDGAGLAVVPRKMTDDMIAAAVMDGLRCARNGESTQVQIAAIWEAAIAMSASPKPQEPAA